MLNLRFAAIAAVAVLALSAPSFATEPMAGGATNPAPMKSDAMSDNTMPTTCEAMMDKAKPMIVAMAAGTHKKMAMREMSMAEAAMDRHHMKSCMRHMKMAMHHQMM